MCGICGIVTDGPAPDLGVVASMIDQLNHRGPDGHGYFRDGRAALGHTRLSIIDESGGAQPMATPDARYWITFNGEIFNYLELRDQLLDRGHRFRSVSDTEVILHAWEEWGQECFSRFNGQWALAIWDRDDERLILSRDRMGVRPLYYRLSGGGLHFASEIKAIFADRTVPRAFDPRGLGEVLTFWSTVAPQTAYAGISQLEPGYVAVHDKTGFRKRPYWSASFPALGEEPSQDTASNADDLRHQLIEAIRLRFLRSDVPVAAYLSGGIDSSVTTAAMSRYTDVPLKTFSLRFADTEFDEGGYQQQMVAKLGAEHHEVTISGSDVAQVFPDVVWHAETPVLRSAPAPMFLLSRLVRSHGFKVVVTGEGADEVLGGYDLFREARVRMFWSRDPQSAKRSRAAELLYPWMVRSPGQAPAFAKSFFSRNLDPADLAVSHRPRWDSTSAIKNLLAPEWQAAAEIVDGDTLLQSFPEEGVKWDPLSKAQWLEMMTLLPGYILSSQGDRMLMGNSVEGRFPFLDANVIALANQLPSRDKLFGLREKYLLTRAFSDWIPEDILRRPKQPYRSPDASAFFGGGAPDWVRDLTSPDAIADVGVFEPARVTGLVQKCLRTGGRNMGNTDSMRVLAVLSTQLAHFQFVSGDSSPRANSSPGRPTVAVDFVESDDRSRS